MGGRGSGGHNSKGKLRDVQCARLDVHELTREGKLNQGAHGCLFGTIQFEVRGNLHSPKLLLAYPRRSASGAPLEPIVQTICCLWRNARYGRRYLIFSCSECQRPARVLYARHNNTQIWFFACRECAGITYQSTMGHRWDRSARRIEKLRGRRFLGIKKIQVRDQWLQTISAIVDNLSLKNSKLPITAMIKQFLGFYTEPMYPKKGCQEIVGKLAAMLDASSRVEIRLNTRVNSLEVDRCSKTAIVHTDNSDIITSKAIVTSHASVTAIYENDAPPLDLNFQTDEYTLIHLLVRDAQPSTFSYVRFYDHEALVRIGDLTKFVQFDEPNQDLKIICAHIRRGHKSSEDLDAIFGFLKTHGYIGEEACVLDYKISYCVDSFLTGKTMEAMRKRYGPVIEALKTDDNLSYAMSENLKRWRKHLLFEGSAAGVNSAAAPASAR